MKITSFYYIDYPDCLPNDPLLAKSEVYIEVSNSDLGSINAFDSTYSITVCTVGFLHHYLEKYSFYCGRSMVIIERFDDNSIKSALDNILIDIEKFAIKK